MSSFDQIRYEAPFAAHIVGRDRFKRISSLLIILILMAWVGRSYDALLLAGIIGGYEVVIARPFGVPTDSRSAKTFGQILFFWICNSISVIGYLIPTLVLVNDDSVAILVAGLLWLFGTLVYITNSFAALPTFYWGLTGPSILIAFLVLDRISTQAYRPSSISEWAYAMVLMAVYVLNTVRTLSHQKDTQKALVTARDEANQRLRALEYLSGYDGLTGLLNRRAFDAQLQTVLSDRSPISSVAVFMIDLDGFKPINDTYSHDAGDRVLQSIATRLDKIAGETGVAGRLGGDEFAVALPAIGSVRAAQRIAENIHAEIERPIAYLGKDLRVGASIGVSLSDNRRSTVASLCATADQAMYRAKSGAANKVAIFDPDTFLPPPTLEDRNRLQDAFEKTEIRPYFQPKVALASGLTCGFEALARWDHPERGLLPPSEFIPQINQLGLQADFLIHMTRLVLCDIAVLKAEGLDPGQVSINVPEVALATRSGRAELDNLFSQFPDVRHHITLEITEDVFINRAAETIRDSISHFRQSGIRVSLDDFGTGFASFKHLRQLEFDELKIDPSFVADLGKDPTVDVLIAGFFRIARGLGIAVIAEGVETQTQCDHLRNLQCETVQWYLFGHALPLAETRIRLFAEQSWQLEQAVQ